MSDKLLKFVSIDQTMPDKRLADDRVDDFLEIYGDFIAQKAEAQASRCSQCGIPFCQTHCPLHNNIPDWLMMTAQGRLKEAYQLSAETNSMPEICGRICPQDRLCEGNCVIEQSGHGSVTIGAVERYLTERAWKEDWVQPVQPVIERKQSVGIIGAGPAGLAAAEALRLKGYQVVVYDRYDRPGGLLIYGIPGFKLEKSTVLRRTKHLQKGGVSFQLNTEIGKDISFDALRTRHDAVLIATGVYSAKSLNCPGQDVQNAYPALDYLIASNREDLGDQAITPELHAKDKHVVVIGGGDTAMDCVRTAIRQDAASVTCLYRRDRTNMPGSQREVANAEEEGIKFEWLAAPTAILSTEDACKANTVSAIRMALGPPDSSGRQVPRPIEGTDFNLPADMVIKALGFDPEDLPVLFEETSLSINRWGAVKINWQKMETSLKGVFAAGDIVRGASLVVWAIKDGRDAAQAIDQYLMAEAAPRKVLSTVSA